MGTWKPLDDAIKISRLEEWALICAMNRSGKNTHDARDRLFCAYIPYVKYVYQSLNSRLKRLSSEFEEDVLQEGALSLVRALSNIDPEKYRYGSSLSGYLYWWVKGAIIDYIYANSEAVRFKKSMEQMGRGLTVSIDEAMEREPINQERLEISERLSYETNPLERSEIDEVVTSLPIRIFVERTIYSLTFREVKEKLDLKYTDNRVRQLYNEGLRQFLDMLKDSL